MSQEKGASTLLERLASQGAQPWCSMTRLLSSPGEGVGDEKSFDSI